MSKSFPLVLILLQLSAADPYSAYNALIKDPRTSEWQRTEWAARASELKLTSDSTTASLEPIYLDLLSKIELAVDAPVDDIADSLKRLSTLKELWSVLLAGDLSVEEGEFFVEISPINTAIDRVFLESKEARFIVLRKVASSGWELIPNPTRRTRIHSEPLKIFEADFADAIQKPKYSKIPLFVIEADAVWSGITVTRIATHVLGFIQKMDEQEQVRIPLTVPINNGPFVHFNLMFRNSSVPFGSVQAVVFYPSAKTRKSQLDQKRSLLTSLPNLGLLIFVFVLAKLLRIA